MQMRRMNHKTLTLFSYDLVSKLTLLNVFFFDVDLIRLDFIFLPKINLKTCRKETTLSWFYCVNSCMHFESKVQWKMELFEGGPKNINRNKKNSITSTGKFTILRELSYQEILFSHYKFFF